MSYGAVFRVHEGRNLARKSKTTQSRFAAIMVAMGFIVCSSDLNALHFDNQGIPSERRALITFFSFKTPRRI